MSKVLTVYVGLHLAGGKEPPASAGYQRVAAGETDLWQIAYLCDDKQLIFPDVLEPGWGDIIGYAAYAQPKGGDPLYIWMLPTAVHMHAGVVPILHNRQLLRGVDVSANVVLQSAQLSNPIHT